MEIGSSLTHIINFLYTSLALKRENKTLINLIRIQKNVYIFAQTNSIMESAITYQKVRKRFESNFDVAVKYYSIMSVLNDFALTEREVQLISYMAVRGNIFNIEMKNEFCKEYKTSLATINNIVSRLRKVGILIKGEGNVKIRPVLFLNFENNIVIQVWMEKT